MSVENMVAYLRVKEFLATAPAIALAQKIERETGKPAVEEKGLEVWCHPELSELLAVYLGDPDLVQAVRQWNQEWREMSR